MEEMVTRQEAATLLKSSVSTVKRREKEGRLTPFRDGHQIVRYRRSEVLALLTPSPSPGSGGQSKSAEATR